jgi:hypothetical protein
MRDPPSRGRGELVLVKHENSTWYSTTLDAVARADEEREVIIMSANFRICWSHYNRSMKAIMSKAVLALPFKDKNVGSLAGVLVAAVLLAHAQPASTPVLRSFDRVLLLEEKAQTSAGVSVGDINGDGLPDIVLGKGRHWPSSIALRAEDKCKAAGEASRDSPANVVLHLEPPLFFDRTCQVWWQTAVQSANSGWLTLLNDERARTAQSDCRRDLEFESVCRRGLPPYHFQKRRPASFRSAMRAGKSCT